MPLNLNNLIEGTVTGVVASVALGTLVTGRNIFRDICLKRKIRKCLKSSYCGSGIYGLTLEIHNHSSRNFTVRHVVMQTNQANYRFKPTEEIKPSEPSSKIKLSKEQKARLAKGEAIEMAAEIEFGIRAKGVIPSGFATIYPYTSHEFLLHANFISGFANDVSGLMISIEYEAYSGDIILLKQKAEKASIEHLNRILIHYKNEFESGNLSKARQMFGLPPVTPVGKSSELKTESPITKNQPPQPSPINKFKKSRR